MILSLGILTVCSIVLWLVSVWKRDASIADLMWGTYFVILTWISYIHAPTTRGLLITILTSIWGIRLSVYLGIRNHKKTEDRRYAAMRNYHGSQFWWRSCFTVFLFQMFLAWLIGFPQQFAHTSQYAFLAGLCWDCVVEYRLLLGSCWRLAVVSFLKHKKMMRFWIQDFGNTADIPIILEMLCCGGGMGVLLLLQPNGG